MNSNKFFILLISFTLISFNSVYARENIINIQQSIEGLFFKTLDLKLDYRVARNITVGVIYKYHGWRDNSASKCPHLASGDGGYSIGVRTNFLFNNFDILEYSSWYLSPYIVLHKYRLVDNRDLIDYTDMVCKDYYESGLLAGYQWFWTAGFNVRLSAGIRHDSEPVFFKKKTHEAVQTRPTVEFTFGFAF